MSPSPLTNEAIRALSGEGCNDAEIAAYTGHEPAHVAAWLAGEWWRPLGHDA